MYAFYDADSNLIYVGKADHLDKRSQRDDTILDVACGPGSVVAAFAPHVRRAVGLDATDAMLDQARSLAAELHLAKGAVRGGGSAAADRRAVSGSLRDRSTRR